MKSAKALARQLLDNEGTEEQIKKLTQKIKDKNNLKTGQDLISDMVLSVGKRTTKALGTLVDPSDTNKYNFLGSSVPTQSSGGGGVISSRPQPTPNVPLPPPPKEDKSVKSATPDIILVDQNDLPIDLILKLTLEKIGAQELISLVRHDIVNGQNVIYQPIKNMSDLAISYNPQNIINIPDSSDAFFKNFPIKLESHIVQGDTPVPPANVYLEETTGNVIIEAINLKGDYQIEVQMITSGKIFNDTIYEEEIL